MIEPQPQRCFLLLQSVCSPFFRRLATALQQAGHKVVKLNFNVGDSWYHWPLPAVSFRGSAEQLPDFLRRIYQQYEVSDQLMFGDQRPVHQQAVLTAKLTGVRNYVFEEGYLRPYWVTLEREGVNDASLLPREPQWYRRAAALLPQTTEPATFAQPFWLRALHDVLYHCGSFWNPLFYPRYRTHALYSAPLEYLGYSWRLPAMRWWVKREAGLLQQLLSQHFFILPLQLDGDAQIRRHSDFSDMKDLLRQVLPSFARHAPAGSVLLIKNHPLDIGWVRYGAFIRSLAEQLGVSERVHYVQTGDLGQLLPHCAGVVTVNSTVGLQALQAKCPVLALGRALYNLPGLTWSGDLAGFWTDAATPDAGLLADFVKVLMHCTQVNGSLYAEPGLSLLVQHSVQRLLAETSPLEALCEKLNQPDC